MIPGIVAQAVAGESAGGGAGEVELLLGFNGSNGGTSFLDEGRRVRGVTFTGNVNTSTAQSKFGGASAYFDGSGDGLFVAPGPGLLFGTAPFTIEFWFRPQRVTTLQALICQRFGDTGTTMAWSVYHLANSKVEFICYINDTTSINMVSTTSPPVNTWTHVAVDRDALGTVRLYINGVMEDSEVSITNIRDYRKPISIGMRGETGLPYQGYIDELRIIKGEAIYGTDAGFTPSAAPFTRPAKETVPDADPYFADVLLLLGFDGPNGSYEVRDDSSYHRSLGYKAATGLTIPVTACQITNVQPGVFARTALTTADTGLFWADSSDWTFGTDPFTVECWMRDDSFLTSHLIGQKATFGNPTNSAWELVIQSDGSIEFTCHDGTNELFLESPATTTAAGAERFAWNHIAVTRDGSGVYRLYWNGLMVLKNSVTTVQNIRNIAFPLTVGTAANAAGPYSGNLDEIRITRGTARYTDDDRVDLPETLFSRDESAAPAFTVDPSIASESGFYAVGDILVLDRGTHNGYQPAIKWWRDGVVIAGETSRRYTLQGADDATDIYATVEVWNYTGITTGTSNVVGPIATAPAYDSDALLTAGDMQSGTDRLALAGDMQSGTDVLLWKERIS